MNYINTIDDQQKLVENHMDIVKWTIRIHITVRESIVGLGYDDLFQEGCLYLCKAAATYDEARSEFVTYAQVVVRNGLMSYCKKMDNAQKRAIAICDLHLDSEDSNGDTLLEALPDSFDTETAVLNNDVILLLESIKTEYTGVARLGIEALELKIKGFNGADIARMYGVRQNHIGAWISRATKKLRNNEAFMTSLGER